MNPAVMQQFEEELQNYRTSKRHHPVPSGQAIASHPDKKLVKARVVQNELKQQRRKQ